VARQTLRRQTPKVGAECPNWARSDLCGGRLAMGVPTAIRARHLAHKIGLFEHLRNLPCRTRTPAWHLHGRGAIGVAHRSHSLGVFFETVARVRIPLPPPAARCTPILQGRRSRRLGLSRRCSGEDLWTSAAASPLLPFSDRPVFSQAVYYADLVQSLLSPGSRALARSRVRISLTAARSPCAGNADRSRVTTPGEGTGTPPRP
jgi:hypothetical protein